jgi:HlyD family secretion protein
MKTKTFFPLVFILVTLLLSACATAAAQEIDDPAVLPPVQDFAVVAEGLLVPKESVQLGFVTGGQVDEIFVKVGDGVKSGDLIARLGNREALEANLAAAEMEALTANLELTAANLELLNAQKAYDDLYENWPDMAIQAEQNLTDARQAAHDAERNLRYKISTADQMDIDVAWSQVVLAEKALEDAEEKYEPYANKPEDNLARANYQAKLAQAQKAYDRAVSHYNALKDPSGEFEISQAEASNRVAQARLVQSQKDYDELLEGPDPDDVALVEAQIQAAETRITTAEGRVDNALVNITAAHAALENLELVAPFDGTVVDLNLILSEQVTSGNPVVTLVDFSDWYVETDNLTEIEVVDITIGQAVTIVPDALPDVTLTGSVETIDDFFVEKRGDITYTARIILDEIDPRMRWGMTVVVTFEE